MILPLVGIYRRSFPAAITWAFLGLFVVGAMAAGAVMELVVGEPGGGAMGSMALNDRLTLILNGIGIVAVIAVAIAARVGRRRETIESAPRR